MQEQNRIILPLFHPAYKKPMILNHFMQDVDTINFVLKRKK